MTSPSHGRVAKSWEPPVAVRAGWFSQPRGRGERVRAAVIRGPRFSPVRSLHPAQRRMSGKRKRGLSVSGNNVEEAPAVGRETEKRNESKPDPAAAGPVRRPGCVEARQGGGLACCWWAHRAGTADLPPENTPAEGSRKALDNGADALCGCRCS